MIWTNESGGLRPDQSHLVIECLYDDGLWARATRAPTDQGGLLGENLGSAGPVSVVVVVQSGQRYLLPGLQASKILYQVVDHTNVFTVQVWLEEFSLLVLEIRGESSSRLSSC